MKAYLYMFSLLILFSGCDAPRDNPFDPDAGNYLNTSTTRIYVRRLPVPNSPVRDALVHVLNLNTFAYTDASGMVEFQHEPVDSINIHVSAGGFFADSVTVETSASHEYQLLLNARPEISDIHFYSVFENWNNDKTHLAIDAILEDIDGQSDIIDTRLTLPDLNFQKPLVLIGNRLMIDPDPAKNVLYIEDISTGLAPENLNEMYFYVSVVNFNQDSARFGPYRIIRTIQETVTTLRPKPSVTESDSIVFSWEPLSFPYFHEYRIILQNGIGNLNWTYTGIPAGQNRYTLKNPPAGLQEGVNFWYLQIIDAHGNTCESNIIPFNYTRE